MKKIICVLLILAMLASLAACGNTIEPEPIPSIESSSEQSTPPQQEEKEIEPPPYSDVFYPIAGPPSYQPGAYFWLDDGKTLVVPNKGEMQYIGLDNQLIKTVTIPDDKLFEYYWLAFTDNRIFVADMDLSVCSVDGKAIITNGSIWDSDNNLVRGFLGFESRYDDTQEPFTRYFLSDGRELESSAVITNISGNGPPVWINDDLVALSSGSCLFLYRLSTDTVTLVDDMSEWMEKYGKFSVYYGIRQTVIPSGEGCYYFAHKNEEKSNGAGTVWYADETGSKVLFDGQEFSRLIYENGMLLMIEWTDDFSSTRLFYATDSDLTLRELASWDGSYNVDRASSGYFLIKENNEPYRFYALDTVDATLSDFVPQIENCRQYDILGIRKNNGSLQYIYSAFIDDGVSYYLYDVKTDTNRNLDAKPHLFTDETFHKPMTHFVERYPNDSYDDYFNPIAVRVRELP